MTDHKIQIVTATDDRRIVDETGFQRIEELAATGEPVLIDVGGDLFEDWDSELLHNDETPARCSENNRDLWIPCWDKGSYDDSTYLELADVRRRMFLIIDANPRVTFCLTTAHPENARGMWAKMELANDFPIIGTKLSFPSVLLKPHEKQAQKNHQQSLETLRERGGLSECEMVAILEDRRWERMDRDKAYDRLIEIRLHRTMHRKNVILGVTVSSQSEANERLPELLKLADLCPVLRCHVSEPVESIEFSGTRKDGWSFSYLTGIYEREGFDNETGPYCEGHQGPCLGWLTIDGGSKPLHPQWVRDWVSLADESGVPVALQWGDFRPWIPDTDAYQSGGMWFSDVGKGFAKTNSESQPGYSLLRFVGREHSGNVLDMRVIDGRPLREIPD